MRAAAVIVAAVVGWAFAQEAWQAHQLRAQAAALTSQNAALAVQNQAYQRDIAEAQSGAAGEEIARQNGYSKPGEKIYVIASPPAAAPTAAPGPVVRNTSSPGPLAAISGAFRAVIGRLHPSR